MSKEDIEFQINWTKTIHGTSFIKAKNLEEAQIKLNKLEGIYGDTCKEPIWIAKIKEE